MEGFSEIKIKRIFFMLTILVGLFFILLIQPSEAATEITSGFFNLSWESDSIAPADYLGKTLATIGSVVKVSLQPVIYFKGKYIDPATLSYKWFLDGNLDQDRQGKGILDFRFRPEKYGQYFSVVRVEAILPDGSQKQEEVTIPIARPKVLLRPNNSVKTTIKENILNITEKEVEVKAESYFFTQEHYPLEIRWFLNNNYQFIDTAEKNTFLVEGSAGEEKKIEAIVTSGSDSLIRGTGSLILKFFNP